MMRSSLESGWETFVSLVFQVVDSLLPVVVTMARASCLGTGRKIAEWLRWDMEAICLSIPEHYGPKFAVPPQTRASILV